MSRWVRQISLIKMCCGSQVSAALPVLDAFHAGGCMVGASCMWQGALRGDLAGLCMENTDFSDRLAPFTHGSKSRNSMICEAKMGFTGLPEQITSS